MAWLKVQSLEAPPSAATGGIAGPVRRLDVPSGSSPSSAGLPLSSKFIGINAASTSKPSDQQAARQPEPAITLCSHGKIVTDPTPTPEKAMLSASPRRSTNQLVR